MDKPATSLVYIGTYADADKKSIFLYQLNPGTGELNRIKGFAGGKKTSYMTFDKLRRHLYAVNEREDYEGKESGVVCSFLVDQQKGYLTLLNRVPSLGSLPVHITSVEASGYHQTACTCTALTAGTIAWLYMPLMKTAAG